MYCEPFWKFIYGQYMHTNGSIFFLHCLSLINLLLYKLNIKQFLCYWKRQSNATNSFTFSFFILFIFGLDKENLNNLSYLTISLKLPFLTATIFLSKADWMTEVKNWEPKVFEKLWELSFYIKIKNRIK